MDLRGSVLVIACGALAREIHALRQANGWAFDVKCLGPELHNRPERIAPAVRAEIRANKAEYRTIFVAYAECGTMGQLDQVLAEEGVERLPGAHCYEFFAGAPTFAALADAEPGTFYLTDFLTRHFERLVIGGLGIDRHPELAETYFRNYRRVVYLSQARSDELLEQARKIASRLGLSFEHRFTGYGELKTRLATLARGTAPAWQT